MQETRLERFEYLVTTQLSKSLLFDENVDIHMLAHDVASMMIVQVREALWGEDVGKHVVEYPSGWWQAFKESYFPEWAKKRWPVVYKRVTVDIKAIYPHFKPSDPVGDHALVAYAASVLDALDEQE